jgi:group II intron reverse transcriptase/maturase
VKAERPGERRSRGSGKPAGGDGRGETASEKSKGEEEESSVSERPEHPRPRRLADWINPTGARKVHSLIDKVYKRKNLEIAWKKVRSNRGAGGIDAETIESFEERLDEQLTRLHEELRAKSYQPQPVRRAEIPKTGQPGEWRTLGIPTIYDRVCQQALTNRLEPIFEPVFDEANFGYRRGRSTKDALRKVWKEIESGSEWIVDADLKDFFGSVDHEKLLTLVAQRVADGRVLRLIEAMLKAASYGEGRLFPTERGTPQGGVVSPLLSNILLTPFDREMRRKGYRLMRYADDWVVTCSTAAEARAALTAATRVLETLGVRINPQKTRIVHVNHGFEFLGFKIKRGRQLRLSPGKIRSGARSGALYAYPREKSIRRFKDQIRALTRRRAPVRTPELIQQINPLVRGWGEYFKRAHVRGLFNQLDRWIVRRIWSHRFKRWRCRGWNELPSRKLYGEYGLANLVRMIPSIAARGNASS